MPIITTLAHLACHWYCWQSWGFLTIHLQSLGFVDQLLADIANGGGHGRKVLRLLTTVLAYLAWNSYNVGMNNNPLCLHRFLIKTSLPVILIVGPPCLRCTHHSMLSFPSRIGDTLSFFH